MKSLATKFQEGNFWSKLLWLAVITGGLIGGWIVIDSLMFFLQTTVGTIGLLILSPFVALGIIALSLIKYPKVKDYNSYSDFTKKYL